MRSSGRGAEHVDLDHLDWVEDAPRRTRSGADRRAAERRSASDRAPAQERRASERRSARARGSAGASPAPRERDPRLQTGPSAVQPRGARRGRRRPSWGPASPSAARSCSSPSCSSSTASSWPTAPRPPRPTSSTAAASTSSAARWCGSCIGVVTMYVLSRVDYAWFRKAAVPLAGLALAGLLLVLVPGVGSVVNGARRWIYPRRPGRAAQRVRQARRRRARGRARSSGGRARS